MLIPFFSLGYAQTVSGPAPPAPLSENSVTSSSQTDSSFEVASVRMAVDHTQELVSRGIQPMHWSSFPTNRVTGRNLTLKVLIGLAYGVDGKYIRNAPDWVDSQLYDVDAKVQGDQQLTYKQVMPLLQDLLTERFHLTVRRDKGETSGFALVIAKGGPKLQPGKGNRNAFGQILPDGLQSWRFDMKAICGLLAVPAGGPIIDNTGLTGTYDVKLNYAPADDPTSALPSFFTALQEQLGLKLVAAKVPVDYLLVEHVDRIPTDN